MNAASFTLLLLLCSKFYFLWGFDVWPQPTAPTAVVLLRDVICWSTLGLIAYQGRSGFRWKDTAFFFSILGLGFLISCFHLFESKGLGHWLQHYIRNSLLPLLFYPAGLAFFRSQQKLQIARVLWVATVINLALSAVQLVFYPHLMWGQVRPTGIIGDPLIMSILVLFGTFAAFSLNRIVSFGTSVASFVILIFASSVSALVSFGAGLSAIGILILKSGQMSFRRFAKTVGVASLGLAVLIGLGLVVSSKFGNQKDLLLPKIASLIQSATCRGDQCQKHWSYEGRILSNRMPIDLCLSNWQECLVGEYSKPELTRLDSTVASLILNWGLIFALLMIGWILNHFRILWNFLNQSPQVSFDTSLWSLIFFSSLAFGLFNSLIYKYPLNILFYLSLAAIKSLELQKPK